MNEYRINHGLFELEVIQDELYIVDKQLTEIERLQSIGYGRSQTALDIAIDVVSRLSKCKALLEISGVPGSQHEARKIEIEINKMKIVIGNMRS